MIFCGLDGNFEWFLTNRPNFWGCGEPPCVFKAVWLGSLQGLDSQPFLAV